jgi:hypothetical protein
VAAAIGYFVFGRAPESLQERAKVVAQAFADGDLASLKSSAVSGSEDDVVQWYGVAHPLLEDRKKTWTSKEILVGALVIEENPRQRSGEVVAILSPAKGTSRADSIASNAELGELARKPIELRLFFRPDSWGKWRLDGKKTNEAAPRSAL